MAKKNRESTGGPGEEYVSKRAIYVLLVYVALLISGVFYGIGVTLPPACVSAPGASGPPSNSNANTSGGSANSNEKPANQNSNGNANASNAPVNRNINANAPINSNTPANNTNAANNAVNTNTTLRIDSISPTTGAAAGNTSVLVKGNGFIGNTTVLFDGIAAKTVEPVPSSGESIFVTTPERRTTGRVDVIVRNPDGNTAILPLSFTYACTPVSESRLLLIVIFAGALGGALHALRSLYWYVGNRELRWSWVPMYLLLPFAGAAMASVFYLILYGGFIPNAPTDGQTYWFIIGIAVLVGMFSQQAALKLRDIANVTLTKPGAGENAMPQRSVPGIPAKVAPVVPVIDIDPPTGPADGKVTIKGTGFTKISKVMIDDVEVADLTREPNSSFVSFNIPPEAGADNVVEMKVFIDDNPEPVTVKYTFG